MFVKRLQATNIRSFEEIDIEFSEGINVIVGPNNAGKSTILKCMLLLQQGLPTLQNEDVRKTKEYGTIHISLSGITHREAKMFPQNSEIIRQQPENEEIVFYFLNDLKGRKSQDRLLVYTDKVDIIASENVGIKKRNSAYKDDECFIDFPGFSSMENELNFIYPFLSKRKVIYSSAGIGKNSSFGITEGLHHLVARIQNLSNHSHPHHKAYVSHCMAMLGFAVGKAPSMTSAEDRLGIFADESEMIYLDAMGEGTANILGLLSIFLTQNNKLFLIEEIENDIHPAALKYLLSLILKKSKNNQFIITTHSNIVLKYLASIPDTRIYYTECSIVKDGGSSISLPTSTIQPVANTPMERLKVLEKLGYDLFDFDLYKSYILFEESSAEQIVRDFIIPEFFPALAEKVKTIAAGGAGDVPARFTDFLRLFVYIHTAPIYKERAWVLVDNDKAGRESLQKLKERFPNWESNFIALSKENFEEYFPAFFNGEVESIRKITDKEDKRKAKSSLLKKVLEWIHTDKENAKEAFKESAKDVLHILEKIDASLK